MKKINIMQLREDITYQRLFKIKQGAVIKSWPSLNNEVKKSPINFQTEKN